MKLKAFTPFHSNIGPDQLLSVDDNLITPPTGTQAGTIGFRAPLADDATRLMPVNGNQILLCVEMLDRILPPAVVRRRVDELAADLEHLTGHKVGRKGRAALKEQATDELLPKAFIKSTQVYVTIFSHHQLMLVWSSSSKRVDQVLEFLSNASNGKANTAAIMTTIDLTTALTNFVHDGGFPADDSERIMLAEDSILVQNGDGGKVRTIDVSIPIGEFVVREVAVTMNTGVTFTVTDNLVFKKFNIECLKQQRELSDKDSGAQEAIAWLSASEAQFALSNVIALAGGVSRDET